MRATYLALAVALGLVLAAGGPLAAQTSRCPYAGGRGMGGQQARPGVGAAPQQMGVGVVEGQVTSVAPDLQLFSVRDPSGKSSAIHVTRETRIMFPDGNLASLADIREGDRVEASYAINPAGQFIASQVNILSEAEGAPGEQQGRGAGPGGNWKGGQGG